MLRVISILSGRLDLIFYFIKGGIKDLRSYVLFFIIFQWKFSILVKLNRKVIQVYQFFFTFLGFDFCLIFYMEGM